MRKKIAVLLSSLICAHLFSEEISLEKAVEMAYLNNKTLKINQKNVEKSEYQIKIIESGYFPTLTGSAGISKNEGNKSSENSGITLNYNLFSGGETTAKYKAAILDKTLSENSFEQSRNDVRLNIIKLYTNILKNKKDIEIYNESLNVVEKEYTKAKILFEGNMSSRIDLIQFEQEMLTIKANIESSKKEYEDNIFSLKNEIGYMSDDDIQFVEPIENSSNINFESDYNEYLKNSSFSRERDATISSAKEVLKASNSAYFPKVDFSLGYSSSDKFVEDWNYRASLSLNYNFFDFGNRKATIDSSKVEYEKIKLTYQKKQDEKKEGLKSAANSVELSKRLLLLKDKRVELAREKYKINKVKYDNQYLSVEDFIKEEDNLRAEERELYKLKMEYIFNLEQYKSLLY